MLNTVPGSDQDLGRGTCVNAIGKALLERLLSWHVCPRCNRETIIVVAANAIQETLIVVGSGTAADVAALEALSNCRCQMT